MWAQPRPRVPGTCCQQVLPCHAVHVREEEEAQTWGAGNLGFTPSSSFTVTRHKPWKPQFPDAVNGGREASPGFRVGEGDQRSSNADRVFGRHAAAAPPSWPKAAIANQRQHFLVKLR